MIRHHPRLRRALRLLATCVLAVPAALLVAVPAHADAGDYRLTWFDVAEGVAKDGTTRSYAQVISSVSQDIGRVTLNDVTMSSQGASSCTAGMPSGVSTLCWSSADNTAEEWIPQGITTSNEGNGGSASRIFATWYDGCSVGVEGSDWGRNHQGCTTEPAAGSDQAPDKGVRISIYVPGSGYRSVLLVEPFNNSSRNPSYHATHMHAGGIALFGRYLYVADTTHGMRVFDTQQILDLSRSLNANLPTDYGDKTKVGRHDGVYYSHGYRWVWPAVGEWRLNGTSDGGFACQGNGNLLKFSYLSIDRSTSRLTAGEYCNNEPTSTSDPARGRVVQWRLGSQSASSPASGLASGWAERAFHLPVTHVQGAAAVGDTFYFNQSNGTSNGMLYRYQLNGTSFTAAGSRSAATGCEDLSYDTSTGRLYSQSEYHGMRAIYSVPATF